MSDLKPAEGHESRPLGLPVNDSRSHLQALRDQRLNEHLATALECEHPLLANLGVATNDLLTVQGYVREVLDNGMRAANPSHAVLGDILPHIDVLVKLSRQIANYTQLEVRIRQQNQRESS